eukprot:543081-Prorocentrum_lima.AAC.1
MRDQGGPLKEAVETIKDQGRGREPREKRITKVVEVLERKEKRLVGLKEKEEEVEGQYQGEFKVIRGT